MVQKITSFKASTGKSFETEYEAWKEELRAWLKAHGVDNDAIAAAIVKAVDDGQPKTLDSLAGIVNGMKKCAPEPKPATALPRLDDERREPDANENPVRRRIQLEREDFE